MSMPAPSEEQYVTVGKLASILGLKRTTVYYWLHREKIELASVGGIMMIPVTDLAKVALQVATARRLAETERQRRKEV